jgi:hypothetical protein
MYMFILIILYVCSYVSSLKQQPKYNILSYSWLCTVMRKYTQAGSVVE